MSVERRREQNRLAQRRFRRKYKADLSRTGCCGGVPVGPPVHGRKKASALVRGGRGKGKETGTRGARLATWSSRRGGERGDDFSIRYSIFS